MSQVPLSEKRKAAVDAEGVDLRRKSAKAADFRPWSQGDHDAVERALARFDQSPPPMGIPNQSTPPREKTIEMAT